RPHQPNHPGRSHTEPQPLETHERSRFRQTNLDCCEPHKVPRRRELAACAGRPTRMLEVRALTKRYSRIAVVDNVSFSIVPREILGYLGPNGSGKSTTVKMLTGLLDPSEGEIFFHGENIKKDPVQFK